MRKFFHIYAAGLITIAILIQGCASIVTRTNYPIILGSNPTEASIKITDRQGRIRFSGTTPTTVNLKSSFGFFERASYTVEYSKAGYQPVIFLLEARLDGWYFGNILFGGLIGMLIVDPATGAMWKLDNYVFQELTPLLGAGNSLKIMDINDVPENMKERMVSFE